MKSLITALLLTLAIAGCSQEEPKHLVVEPTMDDVQLALDRAVSTLNERTNSTIKNISVDWVEIEASCYEHIDYYAQQLLWSKIYYPERETFFVNCELAPSAN